MKFLQWKYLENQATKSQEKLSFSYPPVFFIDFHVYVLECIIIALWQVNGIYNNIFERCSIYSKLKVDPLSVSILPLADVNVNLGWGKNSHLIAYISTDNF